MTLLCLAVILYPNNSAVTVDNVNMFDGLEGTPNASCLCWKTVQFKPELGSIGSWQWPHPKENLYVDFLFKLTV